MSEWVQLRLKSAVLERWQLPNIEYPVRSERVAGVFGADEELPWPELLYGLQMISEQNRAEQNLNAERSNQWQGLEPAMARLAELMVPEKSR